MKYSLHIVHLVTYSSNKAKNNNLKNTKNLSTEIILRCTRDMVTARNEILVSYFMSGIKGFECVICAILSALNLVGIVVSVKSLIILSIHWLINYII